MLGSLAFTEPPGEFPAPEASVLLAVADAVQHHRPVWISYAAPMGGAGRWYLTGADPGIGEDRNFRLDRITDARILPGSFEPPAGPAPAQRVLSE